MKNHDIIRTTILLIMIMAAMIYGIGTRTLVMGDGKTNRLNMVFLAEGYAQSQQIRFIEDVRKNMDVFFQFQPWSNFRNMCNVYAIGVISNDSGSDHPAQEIYKDTYFESSFTIGSISLVMIGAPSRVDSLLKEHVPDYDFVCVLVNDPGWGGEGGEYAVATMHFQSPYLILHETGHSFASLGDEYEGSITASQERKNVTAKTQRNQIRWNVWIDSLTPVPTPETEQYFNVPGLFEGAGYCATGMYRPRYECIMRTIKEDNHFCEVCREEIIVSICKKISFIDTTFPSRNTAVKNLSGEFCSIRKVKPDSLKLKTEWIVNGTLLNIVSDTLPLAYAGLREGSNTVTVRVSEASGMVRIPSNRSYVTDSYVWTIDNGTMGVTNNPLTSEYRIGCVRYETGLRVIYHLPQPQRINLSMCDIRGVQILEKKLPVQQVGRHELFLNNRYLGSGIHIVRFSAGKQIMTSVIPSFSQKH